MYKINSGNTYWNKEKSLSISLNNNKIWFIGFQGLCSKVKENKVFGIRQNYFQIPVGHFLFDLGEPALLLNVPVSSSLI